MVTEINESEFDGRINEICIVDFFATWCPPCGMMSPIFERVSQDYSGKLNFFKVNVDENPMLSQKYQISSVPTLILFKNESPVGILNGFANESDLIKFINSYI